MNGRRDSRHGRRGERESSMNLQIDPTHYKLCNYAYDKMVSDDASTLENTFNKRSRSLCKILCRVGIIPVSYWVTREAEEDWGR